MSDPTANANFSFLDLPDDELQNYSPGGEVAAAALAAAEVTKPDEGVNEGNDAGAASGGSPSVAAEPVQVADAAADKVDPDLAPVVEDKTPAAKSPVAEKPVVSEATAEADKPKVAEAVIDYKAEYERVMAPFKANGKDIAASNVDDVIALMQMGANYNKKMAALKPNLALLKMLENNGLLSEEKIGFLIDVSKKDPGAINKLVKESGLDPMDLDAEKAAEYKPAVHKVDERELELDTVLDEIQTTPTYARTIDIAKAWDGPSKQVIADSPQLLKLINQHVQAGIFDLISNEIEKQRVFGRLQGLSDLQAYKQVGDALHARGGFDHLEAKPSQGQPTQAVPVVVTPNTSQEAEDRIKEKKRAASSPKPVAAAASTPKDFNPLAMSDAEFSKLVRPQYV